MSEKMSEAAMMVEEERLERPSTLGAGRDLAPRSMDREARDAHGVFDSEELMTGAEVEETGEYADGFAAEYEGVQDVEQAVKARQ